MLIAAGNPHGVIPNPLDSKRYAGQPAAEVTADVQLTDEQFAYKGFLEQRIARAQEIRDRSWPEFSRKSYLQKYQQNEKIAMTYLEPKTNEDDVIVASGAIEAKMTVLLSNIEALELGPEIHAFDRDNEELRDLGTAMTDTLAMLAEHDGGDIAGDTEKKMLRQRELLKQGTVFIQDKWCTKRQAKKKLTKKYDGKFDFNAWSTAFDKVYDGPERTLLYGPNVYLGDITQFSMDDQPYVFTLETMMKAAAEQYYGKFENWKYVKSGPAPASPISISGGVGGRTIFDGKFRLTTLRDDQVEIIKYQDPIKDEFQIMINGVMMLPIGFPLSSVTPGGKINIVKQVLYPINPQFAYGKGFCDSGDVYELSRILDELLRLFVLKTRKSVTPAYVNNSGRVISKRTLSPGNITMGIPAGALQKIGEEGQGMTGPEYQFYQELLTRIEQSTISPIFQGQFGKSNTTATEVIQVQEQAKKALGIIVAAQSMMEMKLAYVRIPLVVANFYNTEVQSLDEKSGVYKNVYRQATRKTNIAGSGLGVRRVIPTDGPLPARAVVRWLEIFDEKNDGYPSERIYLSPKQLQETYIRWQVIIVPQQKESSAYEKLIFREKIADVVQMMAIGARPNIEGIEDEFAKVNREDKGKFFAPSNTIPSPNMNALPAATGGGKSAPAAGAPSASASMTRSVGGELT